METYPYAKASAKMAGPCVVCGMRDYNLSMGGPNICPACDCGIDVKDPRHPVNLFSGGWATDQNLPVPGPSRDAQLILAALEQIASDIRAIRVLLEKKG